MKNFKLSIIIVLVLISGVVLFSNFTVINDDSKTSETKISEKEKTDLLALREEEKLARDVYLYAYEKYQLKMFDNISRSEQYHMDKVLEILKVNDIADPAKTEKGVFSNKELQKIYNSLIEKVDKSLTDAITVGATIEDLDIKDIENFKKNTNNEDISQMYNLLACGSRNHMRAFYGQLKFRKLTYNPQYISEKTFKSIIEGEHERCFFVNN